MIAFTPPLFNSSTPWASTLADLAALYSSPYTGAVTTRTSLPQGFPEKPTIHRAHLFNTPATSLNTYGYSPHPLSYYLDSITTIIASSGKPQTKPFIVSVTGTPQEVLSAAHSITSYAKRTGHDVLVEINLSCPNIPGSPPPAYSLPELVAYLAPLATAAFETVVPIGVKVPPYTHEAQFRVLIDALKTHPSVVSFVTSTNTLGGCLHLSSPPSLVVAEGRRTVWQPTLSSADGTGVGGMGGESIHWVSLGNVATIRRLLGEEEGLEKVKVIGVGGVNGREGWERMLSLGVVGVGVGTAVGEKGVGVFTEIVEGKKEGL